MIALEVWILTMVNVGIWAIAMIAMVFLMQDSPVVKKMFPILAGGAAVGIALIAAFSKLQQAIEFRNGK